MSKFIALEFMYPDALASFVNAAGGELVPLSVSVSGNNSYILFANCDDKFDQEKALASFSDRGRGRGLEFLSDEQRKLEAQAAADQQAAIDQAAATAADAQAARDLEAQIRAEVDATVRARLTSVTLTRAGQ